MIMVKEPTTIGEYAENISTLADELGINQKNLAVLLPSMTPGRVSRLVRDHKADPAFAMEIQYAYDVLLEVKERQVMPVSPKSLVPRVLKLTLDMIIAETKYVIMTEEYPALDLSGEDDLAAYEAAARKADELSKQD